jgi:hypothetical protein
MNNATSSQAVIPKQIESRILNFKLRLEVEDEAVETPSIAVVLCHSVIARNLVGHRWRGADARIVCDG